MCGITGAALVGTDRTFDKGQINTARNVLLRLLLRNQARGSDSTGIVRVGDDGNWSIRKSAIPAFHFVFQDKVRKLATLDENHRIVMAHTRNATTGDVNKKNSHPFDVGSLVGIHNGVIRFCEKLNPPLALEVDSHQFFWGLANYTMNHVVETVSGSIAAAFVRKNKPTTLCFIKISNPIEVIYSEEYGILFFSSVESYFKDSMGDGLSFAKFKRIVVPENSYFEFDTLTGNSSISYFNRHGAYGSSGRSAYLDAMEDDDYEIYHNRHSRAAEAASHSMANCAMRYNHGNHSWEAIKARQEQDQVKLLGSGNDITKQPNSGFFSGFKTEEPIHTSQMYEDGLWSLSYHYADGSGLKVSSTNRNIISSIQDDDVDDVTVEDDMRLADIIEEYISDKSANQRLSFCKPIPDSDSAAEIYLGNQWVKVRKFNGKQRVTSSSIAYMIQFIERNNLFVAKSLYEFDLYKPQVYLFDLFDFNRAVCKSGCPEYSCDSCKGLISKGVGCWEMPTNEDYKDYSTKNTVCPVCFKFFTKFYDVFDKMLKTAEAS